ncbi:MAG: hypothetical protein ABL984_17755 [Pyrinomonadaceae bacterium]
MPKIPMITNAVVLNKAIDGRPVYFVTVAGEELVVKAEHGQIDKQAGTEIDAAVSIHWGAKLMKNINNELTSIKIMKQEEIDHFLAAALAKFNQPNYVGPRHLGLLEEQVRNHVTWVKMRSVAGLNELELTAKVEGLNNRQATPELLKKAFNTLSDPNAWVQLGKIIAVDVFNGNNDRFDIPSGRFLNPGNFFFIKPANVSQMLGLDTFSPNMGQMVNLRSGRDESIGDHLNILAGGLPLKEFAARCTRSVGKSMATEMRNRGASDGNGGFVANPIISLPISQDERITLSADEVEISFDDYTEYFARGLEQGAQELKLYLKGKMQKYKLPGNPKTMPPGIIARMLYLNWHP